MNKYTFNDKEKKAIDKAQEKVCFPSDLKTRKVLALVVK